MSSLYIFPAKEDKSQYYLNLEDYRNFNQNHNFSLFNSLSKIEVKPTDNSKLKYDYIHNISNQYLKNKYNSLLFSK